MRSRLSGAAFLCGRLAYLRSVPEGNVLESLQDSTLTIGLTKCRMTSSVKLPTKWSPAEKGSCLYS